MSYISSIRLNHFRNYKAASLSEIESGFVVLIGPNGAGKTNLLEAVSYLSAGRGLRGAKTFDLQNKYIKTDNPWAVSSVLETNFGSIKIGTSIKPQSDRRLTKIQGEAIKSQATLSEYLSCVWLTPQMDSLFRGGASERRRFIDRLLLTYDGAHVGRITRYENALSQRSKLLKDDTKVADPAWLKGLETQMAETGVAIAAARRAFLDRLQKACNTTKNKTFPLARLSFKGVIENQLETKPAVEVEDLFLDTLERSRHMDAVTGGASIGPHRTDLHVVYADKDMEASQCSTGEQKALLIGLILAHSRLLLADQGRPPILLLDEVVAHLDEDRRNALFSVLEELGGQVWMTGTDRQSFDGVKGRATFVIIDDGCVERLAC